MTNVIAAVLLFAGVALELLCCLGVVLMRGVYSRLHFASASSFGALAIGAAVFVQEGPSLVGNKALAVACFLLVSSPILAHVTGRAALLRERAAFSREREEEQAT